MGYRMLFNSNWIVQEENRKKPKGGDLGSRIFERGRDQGVRETMISVSEGRVTAQSLIRQVSQHLYLWL